MKKKFVCDDDETTREQFKSPTGQTNQMKINKTNIQNEKIEQQKILRIWLI